MAVTAENIIQALENDFCVQWAEANEGQQADKADAIENVRQTFQNNIRKQLTFQVLFQGVSIQCFVEENSHWFYKQLKAYWLAKFSEERHYSEPQKVFYHLLTQYIQTIHDDFENEDRNTFYNRYDIPETNQTVPKPSCDAQRELARLMGNSDSAINFLREHPNLDVDFSLGRGQTPLISAIQNGSISLVQALVEHGANINRMVWDDSTDCILGTPLIHAMTMRKSNVAVFQYLLAQGADVNHPLNPLKTFLHIIHPPLWKDFNVHALADLFLKAGGTINPKDLTTLLSHAIKKGYVDIAIRLIDVCIKQNSLEVVELMRVLEKCDTPQTQALVLHCKNYLYIQELKLLIFGRDGEENNLFYWTTRNMFGVQQLQDLAKDLEQDLSQDLQKRTPLNWLPFDCLFSLEGMVQSMSITDQNNADTGLKQ